MIQPTSGYGGVQPSSVDDVSHVGTPYDEAPATRGRRAPGVGDRTSFRSRLSRWVPVDPLVLAVGVVALVTYALHGMQGMLTRDLAVYSYAGQQVAEGVPPYLGILNRAGPLAHALPGLGVGLARVSGGDDVVVLRQLFMVFATLCTCAVYVLGRDLFRSRSAGLVTAATFLTFAGFIQYASNGPREKTPMTLFIVVALWAVTRRRWFTAGVFVSLATLCLQIAFFAAFTAAVVGALFLARGHRTRALARIAAGGAVPAAVCLAYFALTDSVREALDAFVLINSRYTTPDPLLHRLEPVWEDLHRAYGSSVWLLVGGLVALAGSAALTLASLRSRQRRDDPAGLVLVAFAVAVLAALAWNVKEYDAWPDLFPLLPLAAVGIGAVFARVTAQLPARTVTGLAAAAAVACTALALHHSVTTRDDRLVAQRASVAAVLGQLPENTTITSVEAPQPLVLTGRRNPTRHQMFSGGLAHYLEDTWPGGMDGFRSELVEERPTLIAFGDPVSDAWRAAVASDYVYVGSAPDFTWYARASLDEETLSSLRDAAAAAASESGPA